MTWTECLRPAWAFDEAAAELGGDILQSAAWGRLKEQFGWQPWRFWHTARGGVDQTALILVRELWPGLRIGYLPRGPVGVGAGGYAEFAQFAKAVGRRLGCFLWRIDPDLPEGCLPPAALRSEGFRLRQDTGEFGGTQPRLVFRRKLGEAAPTPGADLRRKLRRAQEAGACQVEGHEGLSDLLELLLDTKSRQGIELRAESYYRELWRILKAHGYGELLVVRRAGKATAAGIVARFGKRATYLIGASSSEERAHLPGYRLQEGMIDWATGAGCTEYDLRGGSLYNRDYGLNRFKRQFGEETRLAGERDLPLRMPYLLFRAAEAVRPRIIPWLRGHGAWPAQGRLLPEPGGGGTP
ncbi:MAG: peptidoglycan bridge formation glycyltransferase FemA/FemB family protein [Thermaerobacter sp.]|nr:peptidoglycan bridge formation glycyltransferase FemA/FemB family protein [Thermaerobacter sp.]